MTEKGIENLTYKWYYTGMIGDKLRARLQGWRAVSVVDHDTQYYALRAPRARGRRLLAPTSKVIIKITPRTAPTSLKHEVVKRTAANIGIKKVNF